MILCSRRKRMRPDFSFFVFSQGLVKGRMFVELNLNFIRSLGGRERWRRSFCLILKVLKGSWRWKSFFIWLSLYMLFEVTEDLSSEMFRLKKKSKQPFLCLKFGQFLWYLDIIKFLIYFFRLIIVIFESSWVFGCFQPFKEWYISPYTWLCGIYMWYFCLGDSFRILQAVIKNLWL